MKLLGRFFLVLCFTFTLISLSGCAATRKQEGAGEYIDDTVITLRVKTAILDEPSLKSAEINVETFKGVVQLSGFVQSETIAYKAQKVAGGVEGVKSVYNDMRIK